MKFNIYVSIFCVYVCLRVCNVTGVCHFFLLHIWEIEAQWLGGSYKAQQEINTMAIIKIIFMIFFKSIMEISQLFQIYSFFYGVFQSIYLLVHSTYAQYRTTEFQTCLHSRFHAELHANGNISQPSKEKKRLST